MIPPFSFLVAAPRVDDQVHLGGRHLRHHGVVDDAALLVGEHAQRAGAVGQTGDVADHEALEERDGVLALF